KPGLIEIGGRVPEGEPDTGVAADRPIDAEGELGEVEAVAIAAGPGILAAGEADGLHLEHGPVRRTLVAGLAAAVAFARTLARHAARERRRELLADPGRVERRHCVDLAGERIQRRGGALRRDAVKRRAHPGEVVAELAPGKERFAHPGL